MCAYSCKDFYSHFEQNDLFQDHAVRIINNIYQCLSRQIDFSPRNPIINICLSRLVSQLMEWQNICPDSFDTLESRLGRILHDLPKVCECAECQMEAWWSELLVSHNVPLSAFWYLEHYKMLIAREVDLLQKENTKQRIIFLGCGALPLSPLLLAQEYQMENIIAVDSDPLACLQAFRLIEKYQQDERIRIEYARAEDFCYLPDDLVIFASLLRGESFYQRLHEASVRTLLIRDAEKFYRLMYRPAFLPSKCCYREKRRTRSSAQHINVTRLFERVG